MNTKRRCKGVAITFDLILDMMTEGWNTKGAWIECIEGVPEGAKLVKTYEDHSLHGVVFVIEHESFPELEDNISIPIIRVRHVRHFQDVTVNEPLR